MAKYVQPSFDVYGIAGFKNKVTFDTSVYLNGNIHISSPPPSSSNNPYALIIENAGPDDLIKNRQIGDMAWENSVSWDASLSTIRTDITNLESSLGVLDLLTQNHESSIGLLTILSSRHEASIGSINNHDAVQDVSIIAEWERWVDSNRTGFVDISQTSTSFAESTQTFTLSDNGGGWDYYRAGEKFNIIGDKSIDLPGAPDSSAGKYYIYIDSNDGTLIASDLEWSDDTQQVFVSTITWDPSNNPKYWIGEARHSMLIDRRIYKYLHSVFGIQFISGGSLIGPDVGGLGSTDASNAIGISSSVIADEDIFITLPAFTRPIDPLSPGNNYNIFYRTGESSWSWRKEDTPLPESGSYIEYDNGIGMFDSSDGKFVNSYLLFTDLNDDGRYFILPGQHVFDNLDDAINENPANFNLSGFPNVEYIIAWQFTWATSSSLSTKGKVYLASPPTRVEVNSTTANTPTTTSHNDLLGLQGGNSSERYHLSLTQINDLIGKIYVDTSLSYRDGRLNNHDTSLGSLNDLIQTNIYKNTSQDSSIVALRNINTSQDSSIVALRNINTSQDSSIVALRNINTSQDSSIVALKTRIDNHDISISGLNSIIVSHTTSISQLDASVIRTDAYQMVQDASISLAISEINNTWNGLSKIDNSIGLGGNLDMNTQINTGSYQFGILGSVNITGNLNVDGSITYINSNNLDISDNIISINNGLLETPPVNMVSGIKINRGSENPYFFIFSELDDTFRIGANASEGGLPGGTQPVATREDSPINAGIPFWNDTFKRFDTDSSITKGVSGVTLSTALTLSSILEQTSEATSLMINPSGVVGYRELGTGAFATIANYSTLNYTDSSISVRDVSIAWLKAYNVVQDASISTNSSDITNIETSLGSVNGLIQTNISKNISQDASIIRIDTYNAIQDVSIASIGGSWKNYIDSSLLARDASIDWLNSNKLNLSGGTLTGILNFAAEGFQLDSVTITDVDTSGNLTGLDTHIPTSGAVQKAISNAIVSGVTASNGLMETGGDVQLGGILNKFYTTIDVSNGDLYIGGGDVSDNNDSNHGLYITGNIDPDQRYVQLGFLNSNSGNTSQIYLDYTGTNIYTTSEILVNDDSIGRGIQYFGNYSSTFIDRSLPDVAWVKNYVDSSSVTAWNGLTKTDNSIGLGGTLINDIIIDTSSHSLNLQSVNSIGTADITISPAYLALSAVGNMIEISDGSIVIYGPSAFQGLVYNNDISINFLPSSLPDIRWVQNYVEASTGYLKDYIDGSLAARDTSIAWGVTKLGYVDTSINNIWSKLINHDSSIVRIDFYQTIQDASILAAGTSVKAWNGLTKTDNSIGLGGILTDAVTTIVTNGQTRSLRISGLSTSVNDSPFALVQNSAAGDLYSRQLGTMSWETSTNYVGKLFFDSSISQIYTVIDNIDTSLGFYVIKSGDTMTGALTISAGGLITSGDVSITGNTFISNNLIVSGDTTISGNLNIDGSLYVRDVETIDVSSGYIHLNTGWSGAPASNLQSGIVIDRGTADPYVFIYDETLQSFRIGIAADQGSSPRFMDSSTQAVATREDFPEEWGIGYWNNNKFLIETNSGLSFNPSLGLMISVVPNMLTELTALVWDGSMVGYRELGSNAFSSISYSSISYVDGSLLARDLRLNNHDTSILELNSISISNLIEISKLDSSVIRIDNYNGVQDSSLGALSISIIDISSGKLDAVSSTTGGSYTLYAGESDNIAYIKQLVAGTGATLTQDGSTVTIGVTGAAGYVSKFAYSFSPTGTSEVIPSGTHGLGTGPFTVSVYEAGEGLVYTGVSYNEAGDITLSWTTGALIGDCSVFITG